MLDLAFLKKFVAEGNKTVFPEMLDIDQRLTNIPFLVVPDTIIEPDDWKLFWELWNKHKNFMTPGNDKSSAIWETLGIYKNPSILLEDIMHPQFTHPWDDWLNIFPKMFEGIFSCMPYEIITHITICSNIKKVVPHIDCTKTFYPFPNCLRVMLHDDNPAPSFWCTPWPQKYLANTISERNFGLADRYVPTQEITDKQYVILPKTSNTFVFSNGEFLHGADYHGNTKLLLLVHGVPKIDEWKNKLYSFISKQ